MARRVDSSPDGLLQGKAKKRNWIVSEDALANALVLLPPRAHGFDFWLTGWVRRRVSVADFGHEFHRGCCRGRPGKNPWAESMRARD